MDQNVPPVESQNSPPVPVTPSVDSPKKGFSKILIFIILVILILVGGVGLFFSGVFKSNNSKTTTDSTALPTKSTKVDESVVLLPYIDNFDKLALTDLPNFSDVRSVYDYNGNKIIIGADEVVEYNFDKNEYIRVVKPKAFKSIYSGVVVGNYLYITGDRPYASLEDFPPQSEMNKIDLKSGKVVKTYFRNEQKRYVNLSAVEKNGIIWMYSWDGVLRFDPSSDTFKEYSKENLGQGCDAHGIYIIDGNIKLSFICSNKYLTYDEVSDSFKEGPVVEGEWEKAINKRLTDFNLNLPTFTVVSNKVNNKYYAFSDKGIYTILEGEMPKKLNDFVDEAVGFPLNLYIAKDESKAFFVGRSPCSMGPGGTCEIITVKILNLSTNKVQDLLENNSVYKSLNDQEKFKIADMLEKEVIIDENNGIILVKSKSDNKKILQVDSNSTTVTFFQ